MGSNQSHHRRRVKPETHNRNRSGTRTEQISKRSICHCLKPHKQGHHQPLGAVTSPACHKRRCHQPVNGGVTIPLFSNGMRESKQKDVTLQINISEEVALMELLKFMYSNNLTVTNSSAVLDVLMVADKFDVSSCIKHCSHLLRNLTMTPETVLVYLDLPFTILMSEAFQSLTVTAKQFYVVHYKDMTKFQDEILSLPLAGVEALIASDDLRVKSEDSIYCFVLNWARTNYPNLQDRREIIATRLAKFIRYPYIMDTQLTKLLTMKEFDYEFAVKVVSEAISFKAEVPNKEHTYIRDENSTLNHWFVERAYEYVPIKIIKFEQPCPHCVVYLDLKRDVCASLFPSGRIFSEEFNFGGQRSFLKAECNTDCFGLALVIAKEESSCSFGFGCVVAARTKPTAEFVSRHKTMNYNTSGGGNDLVWQNYFEISWAKFIGEDSIYFIDGVLHLKAELTKVSD
ncbi:hypothetical protein SSX86_028031 [Deinandra increscens subsp. villosa]|uniref:BACK domain-containing protein n=1 Tax=Deinandra increscens subsp. villosa TaxID=3103831 RepID=A0AAP0GKE5_9ASTR